ncbi:hypothetical protein OH77DRAFT_860069 [Trametes cingulata]|nr:hypothetical protein OH77DRAFT_860069 [Trametes cingulata]
MLQVHSPTISYPTCCPVDHVLLSTTAQDPIKSFGRHFARTVDMFTLPAVVIQAGMEYDPERPPQDYTAEYAPLSRRSILVSSTGHHLTLNSCRERRNHASWQALLRMIPNLTAMLMDANAQQPVTCISAAVRQSYSG